MYALVNTLAFQEGFCYSPDCGVEQLVARRAHNPEVAGSSPVPATSRVVANSSPRQTHERRVLLISITRARLSLCTQGSRGVAQGGRSPRVSQSSPPGRPDTHTGRPDGPKVSHTIQLWVSPREGAGLRVGRARWSGHYPRGRERWFGPEPLRTVTRGLCLRTSQRVCFAASGSE